MLVVSCLGLEYFGVGFDLDSRYHENGSDLVVSIRVVDRSFGATDDNRSMKSCGRKGGRQGGEGRGGSGDPAGGNGEILNLLEPRASY